MNEEAKRLETGSPSNAYVKLLIEFGPLAAFGLTYLAGGIFWATAAVMITSERQFPERAAKASAALRVMDES